MTTGPGTEEWVEDCFRLLYRAREAGQEAKRYKGGKKASSYEERTRAVVRVLERCLICRHKIRLAIDRSNGSPCFSVKECWPMERKGDICRFHVIPERLLKAIVEEEGDDAARQLLGLVAEQMGEYFGDGQGLRGEARKLYLLYRHYIRVSS